MRQIESLHRRLVEEGPRGVLEQGLFLLLRLLSSVYGQIVGLRNLTFHLGVRRIFHSRLPVVAVGNLAVGGTGKTPLVDLLIRYAQQQGLRVAVISRGYGGDYSGNLGIVCLGDGPLLTATEAGDEPCLLARRNPQAIVLVAAKRRLAIEYIECHDCADLIILDDAFQHRQVGRDLNLLLLDAGNPFGNNQLLPAGILRENISAVSRADVICLTGAEDGPCYPAADKPVVRVRTQLAGRAVSLRGESLPLTDFRHKKVVAFAGIARPERFFSALENSGIRLLNRLALGDHVNYDAGIVQRILSELGSAEVLLTTEKDAVKLSAETLDFPCFSVGIDVHLDEDTILFSQLDRLFVKDMSMPLSEELLEILACPKCKEKVSIQQCDDVESLICTQCQLAYPVRDGIPVMLIDEATAFDG